MSKKPADFTSDQFSLRVLDETLNGEVMAIRLHASDRFSTKRHLLERKTFALFTRAMEAYLRKRPHLDFEHPKNHIRKIIYVPPALRAWAAYMPGGFATFHVHNPDRKKLRSGKKIDYITRNLFRHSSDAIGLRSRAYAMSWYLQGIYKDEAKLRWMSIACGSGQPTFDAARLFDGEKNFYLCDIDKNALALADELAHEYGIAKSSVHLIEHDLKRPGVLEALVVDAQPQIIEAMGLFEYLDEGEAVEMLRKIRGTMSKGGSFVFSNMHADHPQLQVHKRGLGWPGVLPRTSDQVKDLIEKAGFGPNQLTILLPDDNVYAVYCIRA
ncbi:class I SAM-dependent methyltransferase [Candidatus Saccharibacteria bacterium]|nr:class I SAM-dependent methyltransferase [Candidatus Saccharibacteria bacterium]MBH1972379.1 class I SAM-dependent methyltransferase [Candidatus Saccharibacteria bacterium]MBH1990279.1 class I SAM-dependent methyltransferase [Candidatus Saccharibacteria bacterium]